MSQTDVEIETIANRYLLNAILGVLEELHPGASEAIAQALRMTEDAERLRDNPDGGDAKAIAIALREVQAPSSRPTLSLVRKD